MTDRFARYDYRGLGRMLRVRLEDDGRGWRTCAAEIGVCASDLSRICNGQSVSAAKIIAVCDWLEIDLRSFYEPGAPSASRAVSQAAPAGAPPLGKSSGGRATRPDGQSTLPPAAEAARETVKMFHGKSTETAGLTDG